MKTKLYILAFLVVLLMFFNLNSLDKEIEFYKNDILAYETKAKEYESLKKDWDTLDLRKIENILKNPILKQIEIKKTKTKELYKIKANILSSGELDYLNQEIFSKKIKVKSLNIKRLSEQNASLEMEIGL